MNSMQDRKRPATMWWIQALTWGYLALAVLHLLAGVAVVALDIRYGAAGGFSLLLLMSYLPAPFMLGVVAVVILVLLRSNDPKVGVVIFGVLSAILAVFGAPDEKLFEVGVPRTPYWLWELSVSVLVILLPRAMAVAGVVLAIWWWVAQRSQKPNQAA